MWKFDAKLGIISTPITYQIAGQQYVSVLVGYGSPGQITQLTNRGWKFNAQPRRLLTFRLDGYAALPVTAPRDFSVHAVDDPRLVINDQQAVAGGEVFAMHCALCHGAQLAAVGSPGPDLRESRIPLDWQAFQTVVQNGALKANGMPQFDMLSDGQLHALFMYIRKGARDASHKTRSTPRPGLPAVG